MTIALYYDSRSVTRTLLVNCIPVLCFCYFNRSESTPATTDTDISIVKVESEVTYDEQFHGDDPGLTFDQDDQPAEWNREDNSNEESNASEDKMPQWMTDSMKGKRKPLPLSVNPLMETGLP